MTNPTPETERKLTPEEKAVLFHFGLRQGDIVEPGGFVKALIEAMVRADDLNIVKLHKAFPEYADAVNGIQYRQRVDGSAYDLENLYNEINQK